MDTSIRAIAGALSIEGNVFGVRGGGGERRGDALYRDGLNSDLETALPAVTERSIRSFYFLLIVSSTRRGGLALRIQHILRTKTNLRTEAMLHMPTIGSTRGSIDK